MFCQSSFACCERDHLVWPARAEAKLCATLVNGIRNSQGTYKMRTDVNAVIHARALVAPGYAAAGITLNTKLVSEAFMGLGAIPPGSVCNPWHVRP